MKIYKELVQKLIIIVFCLIVFLIPQNSYSEEGMLRSEVKMGSEDIYFSEYVEKIYQEYADRDFEYVYQQLHPDIKEIITENEYRVFQEKNFNKYKLKLDDIKVGSEVESIELPDEFSDIVIDIEGREIEIFKVPLSYNMDFTVAGSKKTRQIENQVYILKDNNQFYLLWDPSIIKKGEKGEEE